MSNDAEQDLFLLFFTGKDAEDLFLLYFSGEQIVLSDKLASVFLCFVVSRSVPSKV